MAQSTAEQALKKLEPLIGERKLWRTGEPFPQRFTATIIDDGSTIAGRWEKAEDGTNYTVDFDMTYRRVR